MYKSFDFNDLYANRTFQSLDSPVSGKSVVLESGRATNKSEEADLFPFYLSDYLRNFIGKAITVKYSSDNGRYAAVRGVLRVVGMNFIGVQPNATDDLFLLELASIKSVNVNNYKGGRPARY